MQKKVPVIGKQGCLNPSWMCDRRLQSVPWVDFSQNLPKKILRRFYTIWAKNGQSNLNASGMLAFL